MTKDQCRNGYLHHFAYENESLLIFNSIGNNYSDSFTLHTLVKAIPL